MSRRTVVLIVALLAVAALVVAALVFKPWLVFVDVAVNDTLPEAAPTRSAVAEPTATETADPVPVQLATGSFISHEHETSGTVRIVENPDGTRVLALENLSTSSGPDVHVWLSASDVIEGQDGWFTAGGAAFYDLGPVKGNLGNQVYEIPADVDLAAYRSVSLWCVQFSVSFGAAQLS